MKDIEFGPARAGARIFTQFYGVSLLKKHLISLLILWSATTAWAQKPFQNGQAARAVIGQTTFTEAYTLPSQQILGGVSGLAYYGGTLWVADSNRLGATPQDDRILGFDVTKVAKPTEDITQNSYLNNPVFQDCRVCGAFAQLSLGQNTFSPPTYTPTNATAPVTAFYNGVNGTQDQAGTNITENPWLFTPTAVATDGVRLAVADTDNNRILIWNSIPVLPQNKPPDMVLGQPDLNTIGNQQLGVVSATTMRGPQGVWIKNNRLYVSDTQNHRVLIWNTFPTHNNQAPDIELGQPDFSHANAPAPSNTAPTAAKNQLYNPVGVTTDDSHIYVADLGFNRVLIWNTLTPSMDQGADVVVGQPDFTQSAANNPQICINYATGVNGQCQTSLNFPRFALSDGTRLFIADGGNDRVLIYNTIPTTNAAPASNVLGQTTFTNDIITSGSISIVSTQIDNTAAVDTIPTPTSLAWDGTNLYVADPYNRRVLVFTAGDSLLPSASDPAATVTPVVNWASEIVRQEGFVVFTIASGGKINAGDKVTVTLGSNPAYSYTIKSTDTLDIIAKNMVAIINADSSTPAKAIFAGPGSGALYLSSVATNLAYDSISLAVSPTASSGTNVVVTASGAYLSAGNAATASAGALIEVNAPKGVLFSSDPTTYIAPPVDQIPTSAHGVQLYVDGYASPLYKVTPTQIVGQIPWTYTDRNSTSIYVRTVRSDGSVAITNATPVYIAPANPGVFSAPLYPNQSRPWNVSQAYHQSGNPTEVISVDGSATAADTATITVGSTGYTYTVQTNDTLRSIVNGLVALINGAVSGTPADPNVTASAGGAFTRVVLTARNSAENGGNGIAVTTSVSTNASVTLTPYGNSATCCDVLSNSPIYPGNPAVPGELISVSASGLGSIVDLLGNPITPTTGVPYSGPYPNNVTSADFVAATMGGQTAQVIYQQLPSGSYGIYNVQVIVPTGLPANDATPFYIAQNAFISNTVTIPIGNAVGQNPPPPPPGFATSPISMNIDAPISNATVGGTIAVTGFVVDTIAKISSVEIGVDGIQIGAATKDLPRADVNCVVKAGLDCPNVGFSFNLDTTLLGNGAHRVQATATDTNGTHYTAVVDDVDVYNDQNSFPTRISIDTPSVEGNVNYHGLVQFNGWAVNPTSPITSVIGYLDGAQVAVTYGNTARTDVCSAFPGPSCPNVGWTYLADLTWLGAGNHQFTLTAVAANGQRYSTTNTFVVNNFTAFTAALGPSVSIDVPGAGAGTVSGYAQLGGWAASPFAAISNVAISVDGVFFGYANYGSARTDACATYSTAPPGCPNVGWYALLDTTGLSDGQHTLAITALPNAGQSFTTTRTFTVGNLSTQDINIGIDSPTLNATLSGPYPIVGGWAVSSSSPIQSVNISIDGVGIQPAAYGGNRSDVCNVFPGKLGCPNVGWSAFLNTTRFPNGQHMFEVTATTASGKRATAGMAFNISNVVTTGHTNIDVPGPNTHPLSGVGLINGWAVNDHSPITTISIAVDGVPKDVATYGDPRPDVCAVGVYPGRPGCPNVGWHYALDTSYLADGAHTLDVIAYAADGTSNAVSASFQVANWTAAPPLTMIIDRPNGSTAIPFTGTVNFGGWLFDNSTFISSVYVYIDGVFFGPASYHGPRPDVCAIISVSPDCPNVGWNFPLDTTLLSNDTHTLTIVGTSNFGQSLAASQQFSVSN